MGCVLVPVGGAAGGVVVVWRLCCVGILKRELVDTGACGLRPSFGGGGVVDGRGCRTALHFGVKARESQDGVPTLCWLPGLHGEPYKAGFIANSGSCATTELSKLLTLCLAAVKRRYQILWKGVWGIR